MSDKAIYTIYESEVQRIMKDLDIPVTEEMKRIVVDHVQDYLNQTIEHEIASYIDCLKNDKILEV